MKNAKIRLIIATIILVIGIICCIPGAVTYEEWNNDEVNIAFIFCIIGIIFIEIGFWWLIIDGIRTGLKRRKEEQAKELQGKLNAERKIHDAFYAKLSTTPYYSYLRTCSKVTMMTKTSGLLGLNCQINQHDTRTCMYMGIVDNNLYLVPSEENKCFPLGIENIRTLVRINIDSIKYYLVTGDEQIYTKVSGGGTSIGGALIGGALFGDAGAIIGSRKSINTTVHTHDTRVLQVYCIENDTGFVLEFDYKDIDEFRKLLPTKDKLYKEAE